MIFQRRRHKRPISILSRPYSSVSDTITFSPAIITEIHQNFSTAAGGTDGLYVIVYVSIHFQVEIEKKKKDFQGISDTFSSFSVLLSSTSWLHKDISSLKNTLCFHPSPLCVCV